MCTFSRLMDIFFFKCTLLTFLFAFIRDLVDSLCRDRTWHGVCVDIDLDLYVAVDGVNSNDVKWPTSA